jgi:hypothetical protein
MPKLTLSVDDWTIAQAKKLAEKNRTSVSKLFSQFITSITGKKERVVEPGPLTRQLMGTLPPGTARNYKKIIADELAKKYGL